MSEETKPRKEGQSDEERAEEIAQFLRQEYGGKRLPHAINELRVGSHPSGDGVPYVTLDTGTWNGQITVVGVRWHDGQYELRDYENRLRRYKTFEQLKEGLAGLLAAVTADELDRAFAEGVTRQRPI